MAVWSVLFVAQALPQEGSDITDGLCGSFIVLRKGVFLKTQQRPEEAEGHFKAFVLGGGVLGDI